MQGGLLKTGLDSYRFLDITCIYITIPDLRVHALTQLGPLEMKPRTTQSSYPQVAVVPPPFKCRHYSYILVVLHFFVRKRETAKKLAQGVAAYTAVQ